MSSISSLNCSIIIEQDATLLLIIINSSVASSILNPTCDTNSNSNGLFSEGSIQGGFLSHTNIN
jgi:hypothetical protein